MSAGSSPGLAGLLCAFAFCLAHSAAAPAAPDPFAEVRAEIRSKLVEEQVPSLAVAVVRNGTVVWEEAFGWADRENRVPATAHTMYEIGSVSKPITATGLMVLVERGRIDLDRPANQYLGDASLQAHIGNVEEATVRRLANHTSGLTRYSQHYFSDEMPRPPMPELIRRYGHVLREPGEIYEYSNFGYAVLSHVIERTAGASFADFMRREVFLPLGMTHTAVGRDPSLESYHAAKYGSDQSRAPVYDLGQPGAGDVHASVHDMARFALLHLQRLQADQKKILKDSSITQMQKPGAAIDSEESYGTGWYILANHHGYRLIYHTGHTSYSTASLMLFPEESVSVVALTNGSTDLPVRVSRLILGKLLPNYAERLKQAENRPDPAPPESYKPTPEWLGHWTGSIDTAERKTAVEMWFKESGDIQVQMKGQLVTLLSGARLDHGYLRGSFSGDIGTDDANRRRPYNLHLRLKPRGEILNGSITASSLPGRRAGSVLSYWVELKKMIPDKAASSGAPPI